MDKPLEEVALDAGRQVGATGCWLRERGPQVERRSLHSSLALAATQVVSEELEFRALSRASLVAQLAKNPPAMQETLV